MHGLWGFPVWSLDFGLFFRKVILVLALTFVNEQQAAGIALDNEIDFLRKVLKNDTFRKK